MTEPPQHSDSSASSRKPEESGETEGKALDQDDDLDLRLLPGVASQLRRLTVRQTSLTVSGQLLQTGIQYVAVFVLARILAPADFGLIAMVAVFVGFLALFRDIGLTQAVVQRSELSSAQVSGLFWVNAAFTTAFTILTIAIAPLVAGFYGEPALLGITAAFGIIFFINGFGAIPQAVLSRRMSFDVVVRGEIIGSSIGVVAAILIAIRGGGYWALVASPALRAVFTTSYFWLRCSWRPATPKGGAGIGSLMRFGTNVTGFNLVNFMARNADNLLIGRYWGAGQLGQYNAAYRLLVVPLTQISTPISRVVVPALSRMVEDPIRYRRSYLRVVAVVATITMPAMALAAVCGDWIVDVLLGPGWEEAGDILRWLALAGIFQPVANTVGWLFLTQDRTADWFRLGLVSAVVAVSSFIFGLQWGAIGVAAAYAIADIAIRTPLLLWWFGRRGPVTASDLLRSVALPLAMAGTTILVGALVRYLGPLTQPAFGLAVAAAIAFAFCGAMLRFSSRGRAIVDDGRIAWADVKSRTEPSN